MKFRFWFLLACVVLFGSPCNTKAATPEQMQEILTIANTEFPNSPCQQGLDLDIVDTISARAMAPESAVGVAYIYDNVPCAVEIEAAEASSLYGLCAVYVHEFGHWARHDAWHSPDPNNVMAPAPGGYQPCIDFRDREAYKVESLKNIARNDARSVVKEKLGKKWKVRVMKLYWTNYSPQPDIVEQWEVTARKKQKTKRLVVKKNSVGQLVIRRY